ncbi:MAG: hypothetical protein V1913_14855 [Fibrobacterota bacterium]
MKETGKKYCNSLCIKKAARIAIWAAFLLILLFSARETARTSNTDYRNYDQGAVLLLADSIRASGNPFRTDANRHPLFSALLAATGITRPSDFPRAQAAAMAVGALFFILMFLAFGRTGPLILSAFLAVALALPQGLPLFLTQAIPDLLFTLLNLFAWYFFAKSFGRWKYAFGGGALAGAAFLAKQSGFMTWGIYLACMAAFGLFHLLRRNRVPALGALKAFLAAAAVFAAVAAPLLHYNRTVHGRMLYNVNSDYYLWAESWKACQEFSTRSHDRAPEAVHRAALAAMGPAEVPSFRNFFAQHSIGFMLMRFKAGLHLNGLVWWNERGLFFLLLLVFVALYVYSTGWKAAFRRLLAPASLYSITYMMLYFAAMTWYAAIAFSLRFLYPLHAVLCAGLFLWLKENTDEGLIQPPV